MKKLIVVTLLLLASCTASQEVSQVCFEDDCFRADVADTPKARAQGLMYRARMDEDKGMLFVFNQSGTYPFWMKNTLISLDMIWLDEDKEVVYVQHNATPCREEPCTSYDPGVESLYVFEVNAGIAREKNITVGDKAEFR